MQATTWPFLFGIPHFEEKSCREKPAMEPVELRPVRVAQRHLCGSIPMVDAHDHVLGDPAAKIILVQYGDYTCPQAAWSHDTVKAMIRHFGAKLGYVFRHFPMTEQRPMAHLAAEAAEAAAEHGAFWKMHERLLTSPAIRDSGFLTWHAAAIGLDVRSFIRKMDLREHQHKVAAHASSAQRAGVRQAPTFFINGQKYPGIVESRSMIQAIERAVA